MNDCVTIPSFSAPVLSSPDVCVIGAGAAGVSAAVAAGRLGLDVLLLEKYGFAGGAAVAGLSGTICGLHSSGAKPEQIVFGFAEEFRSRLEAQGGVTPPIAFGKTALVAHDPFCWKITADALLREAGVRVLFHSQFLEAYGSLPDQIDALLVRLAEGSRVIKPRMVIDASGDALVVHSIGLQTGFGANGVVQTPTMIFRLGAVDMPGFLQLRPSEICDAVTDADKSGKYRLPRHHVYLFPMPSGNEVLCNMTRITYPDGRVPVGTSSEDLTFAEIEGRSQACEYARFLRDTFAPFSKCYIVDTGAQVGIRQTRSIIGKQSLTNDDVTQARKHRSPATHSAWPIELHAAGALKLAYLENDHYDIPFECLIPQRVNNLLVAGRCLSAEHEALASARVTAQCFGMGYASGAASGLALREKLSCQDLTGEQVADWMRQHKLKTSKER
jgi:hypothetical protein